MSKEPKTRFFAKIDGIDRVLFSVKQTSDKGLTITSRTPKFWENPDGKLEEFADQHYSVHPSNDWKDTTFTQKTLLQDSTHYSNATFLRDTRENLLWLVFARRYPEFLSSVGVIHSAKKDTLIQLAEFNYTTATLLYSVFVAKNNFDLTYLREQQIDFRSASFEEYMVIAIPTYINLPSDVTGDVCGFKSSTTVINGLKSADHRQLNLRPLPALEILSCHFYFMNTLRSRYIQRLAKIYQENGGTLELAPEMIEFVKQPGIEHFRFRNFSRPVLPYQNIKYVFAGPYVK